jgi:hypothetical protein
VKSGEARLGEATTALTALLEAEGVEDARRKAHDFMTWMLREGWRTAAPAAYRPTLNGDQHAHPDTARREATVAREQIRESQARFKAGLDVQPDAPSEENTG